MAEYPYSAVAVQKYKSAPGSSPFSFVKGEVLTILEAADDDGDWVKGTSSAGGAGVFPVTFVERVEEEEATPEIQPTPIAAQPDPQPPSAPIEPPAPAKEAPAPTPILPPPSKPAPPAAPSPSAPDAPAKPQSLRDRIAALNASGAGAAGPPVPRAKPSFARKPYVPPPAAASYVPATPSPAHSTSPPPRTTPLPTVASSTIDTERLKAGDREGAMSAEDAKESIGKGGSLKDRIKALQGLSLDAMPGLPGRPPKPRHLKSDNSDTSGPVTEGGEVGTVTEAGESDGASGLVAPAGDDESTLSPEPQESVAAPVMVLPLPVREVSTSSVESPPPPSPGLPAPAIIIPALPKRAGPPRRRAAIAAAALPEKPAPTERSEEITPAKAAVSSEPQSGAAQPKPTVEEVVPQSVLSTKEEVHDAPVRQESTPIHDDEFETPTLPAAEATDEEDNISSEKLANAKSSLRDQEDEDVDEREEAENEEAEEEEEEGIHEDDEDEIADNPVESPAPTPPHRPSLPPPPPPPTGHVAFSVVEEAVVEEIKPSPVSVNRPNVPPSFNPPPTRSVATPIVIPSASVVENDDNDSDSHVPSTPATKSRPAIPGIPTSFALPQRPVEREAIIVPKRMEEPAAEDENQDESETDAPAPESISEEDKAEESALGGEATVDEEEDVPEEDPEVERRRALAARMAKLGGMNMRMGPMMPPIGGFRKTTAKQGSTSSVEEPSRSSSIDEQSTSPPPRRIPGIPIGGMLLPGIVPRAPPPVSSPETEEDKPLVQLVAVETSPQLPIGRPPSQGPPKRSIPIPVANVQPEPESEPEPEPEVSEEEQEDYADEDDQEAVEEAQSLQERDEDDILPPPLPAGRPPQPYHFTEEPSLIEEEEVIPVADEPLAASQPPPSRSVPLPGSPPQKRTSRSSIGRGILGVAIPRGSLDLGRGSLELGRSSVEIPRQEIIEPTRQVTSSSTRGGQFKAVEVDLDGGWWRSTPFSPPTAIKGRSDAIWEVSESSATKRGKTRHDNEIEVIYDDLSKTIIKISFTDDDISESTTSVAQTHFPPPPFPSDSELQRFSSTFGGNIYGAASGALHQKGRPASDSAFIAQCLSQAGDVLPPIGYSYGIRIFRFAIDGGSKNSKPILRELDEPRAGDIVVLTDAKFKSNLLSKSKASDGLHLAVVKSWDGKKKKIGAIDIGKDGHVDEATFKLEDLKAGEAAVFRVVERSFLDWD